MMSETLASFMPLIRALESLDIPYYIGGSVGSSHYGKLRSTVDTDVVADLKTGHVNSLCQLLLDQYYVDDQSIKQAIAEQASFNIIHLETSLKVDVFILKQAAYDQMAFSRRRREQQISGTDMELAFASPEDIILHKLYWFRLGGEVSERQWSDVLGVLQVQSTTLDEAYMDKWAAVLNVADLLSTLRQSVAELESDR